VSYKVREKGKRDQRRVRPDDSVAYAAASCRRGEGGKESGAGESFPISRSTPRGKGRVGKLLNNDNIRLYRRPQARSREGKAFVRKSLNESRKCWKEGGEGRDGLSLLITSTSWQAMCEEKRKGEKKERRRARFPFHDIWGSTKGGGKGGGT